VIGTRCTETNGRTLEHFVYRSLKVSTLPTSGVSTVEDQENLWLVDVDGHVRELYSKDEAEKLLDWAEANDVPAKLVDW
jgi:hypothetical protein